jgi:hypothetical protein
MTVRIQMWARLVKAARAHVTRQRFVKLLLAYLNRLPPCCM